ncbi:MAG: hypothetical protein IBJ13_06555 [Sphingopyxis sp.]|nr:hypothetical protein [Sphingopyxis sp.]
MRTAPFLTLLISALVATAPLPAAAAPADDRVLVIGALHGLHEREPAFSYDRLRAAILAFAPDVLVLEVRPDELAERKPTPGRPEYPAVIWPLLGQMKIEAISMEPGGDTFKAITGEAGEAFGTLKQDNPEGAAALSRLDKEMDEWLLTYWQRPEQVQDETTASLTASLQAAQFALAGPRFAAAQARWEDFMSDRIVDAIKAHPGKRIMVIGSYKNRALLEQAARRAAPERAVSAMSWFQQPGPEPAKR